MERNDFFKLAQKATVHTNEFKCLKKELLSECVVVYDGIKYYPISIEVGFDEKGNTKNTAWLHDLKANSIIRAELSKVEYLTN